MKVFLFFYKGDVIPFYKNAQVIWNLIHFIFKFIYTTICGVGIWYGFFRKYESYYFDISSCTFDSHYQFKNDKQTKIYIFVTCANQASRLADIMVCQHFASCVAFLLILFKFTQTTNILSILTVGYHKLNRKKQAPALMGIVCIWKRT